MLEQITIAEEVLKTLSSLEGKKGCWNMSQCTLLRDGRCFKKTLQKFLT